MPDRQGECYGLQASPRTTKDNIAVTETHALFSLLRLFVIGHGGPNSDLVEENVTFLKIMEFHHVLLSLDMMNHNPSILNM